MSILSGAIDQVFRLSFFIKAFVCEATAHFTTALGQAKSPTDAIELHSRFASERYSTLLRQTNEIAELMRRSTFAATTSVRLSVGPLVA
jgi:hypothetical protein